MKREILALYYAYRNPNVDWWRKAWLLLVVGYALSPIDLIPDFIPLLGYLDDAILLPMGIWVARRLIPAEIMEAARQEATAQLEAGNIPHWRWGVLIILLIWVSFALVLIKVF
jgi:uncharacterized membrane protein YkvA (DUF1232 family)